MTVVKTQKAKGILFCLDEILDTNDRLYWFFRRLDHKFINNVRQIKRNYFLPCFARPCPTQPRHGFVDSRVIKTNQQLLKLWEEVKSHDPDGEIILGPYFPKVKYNSVYVNNGILSIGEGNDGATAGKDSVSFFVAPYKLNEHIVKEAGIDNKDAVYLESIYSGHAWYLTQMRGGPKLDTISPDFIPKKTKVMKVVEPNDNLIEWEKQAKSFEPGTVVYGDKHTLASHAAIHCILNKIPFITTHKPEVGETLLSAKKKETKLDRKQFRLGVSAGIDICNTADYADIFEFFHFSLSVLHNWAYIKYSPHADWLLGSASVLFTKVSTALLFGEYRHKNKGGYKPTRENVYEKIMHQDTSPLYELPKVFKDFYLHEWGSGFGGVPWATCAWYSHSLWKNIVSTYNKPRATISDKEISNIVSIINKTVNLAHNNGWWFNKIAKEMDMDFVANEPGLAAFCVAHVFAKLYNEVKLTKDIKKELRKPNRVDPPCRIDSNGRLMWLRIYGISAHPSVSIWREDGDTQHSKLSLSEKEIKSLYRKYKRRDRDPLMPMVLKIKAGNKFDIGGKSRDLKKVFGLAI